MMRPVSLAVVVCVSLTVLLSGGCGSGSGPGVVDQVLEPRIQEYVGDGGGSLKPWPGLMPGSAGDSTSALGTKLIVGEVRTDKVPRRLINWYRLTKNVFGTPATVVFTLQPTADEDSDLFVFEGKGKDYQDGSALLGGSWRSPTAPGRLGAGGYAPDWVAAEIPVQGSFPMAHVAVYGYNEVPKTKHYRLEYGPASGTSIGQGSVYAISQYKSLWTYIDATSGTQYTLDLDSGTGDIDIFLYGENSSQYIGSDTTTGDAEIVFTASATRRHYIRVYGYGPGINHATLTVTSP